MIYDMQPYELLATKFTAYLYQRGRELYTYPGMSRIQLYDGDNCAVIDRMKEDFCALHGVNSTNINIRWALLKAMTEYTIKHLGFVPKEIKGK